MKLEELHRKQVKIKILWKIHSILGMTWTSEKIHQLYNEMKRYGHWDGQDLIIKEIEG